jgi:hypothetical protein
MRLEKTVLYESDKAAPEFSRQLNERKRHSASKNDIEYNIDESTHGSASNWERSRLLTTLGEFWKRAVALLANEVLTYTNRNMNKFNRSCHNNEWPVEHGCFGDVTNRLRLGISLQRPDFLASSSSKEACQAGHARRGSGTV